MVLTAVALAPGRADACSYNDMTPGLELWELYSPPEQLRTVQDGVIALYGTVYREELADVVPTVTVTLTRDGVAVETTIELLPLSAGIFADAPTWTVAVVARPAQPLEVGEYQVEVAVDREDYGLDEMTFPLVVEAGPLAPLEAPTAAAMEATESIAEYGDRICCETEFDSCGGKSRCIHTTIVTLPALHIEPTALPPVLADNSVIWAQRLGADGVPDPSWRFQFLGRSYVEWEVPFAAAQPEYCVVLGATSLVDGTSVSGPPLCKSRDELGEPHEETSEVPPDAFENYGCLTPPLYEDGTPFGEEAPAEETSGCRQADGGGAWAWLLVAAGLGPRRHRRRA